ncbi:MAG: redoxin domain-containing protein [Polyangiaceae bacterium]
MAASLFRRFARTLGLSVAFTLAAYAPAMLPSSGGPPPGFGVDSAEAGQSGRAWIGVELTTNAGVVTAKHVLRGSPAEMGGVQAGDELLSIDGAAIQSSRQLIQAIQDAGAGKVVSLKVKRAGAEKTLSISIAAHPGEQEVLRRDKVGTYATALGGHGLQSGEEDVTKLKGRVVLIDFWATWCSACKAAGPALTSLSDKYGAQGLTVIGATADTADAAEKAAKKFGMTYGIVADVNDDTITQYSVSSLPTMYLVDKNGVIRDVLIGFSDEKTIDDALAKLLAERNP